MLKQSKLEKIIKASKDVTKTISIAVTPFAPAYKMYKLGKEVYAPDWVIGVGAGTALFLQMLVYVSLYDACTGGSIAKYLLAN